MAIFDNKYVAFTNQCVAKSLTRDLGQQFNEHSNLSTPEAGAKGSKPSKEVGSSSKILKAVSSEQIKKKVKVQERGGLGREGILHFYTTSYKKELTRLATE